MIIGSANAFREAVIRLTVANGPGKEREIEAVIDTGFYGVPDPPGSLNRPSTSEFLGLTASRS
jgi:hypothetical protein